MKIEQKQLEKAIKTYLKNEANNEFNQIATTRNLLTDYANLVNDKNLPKDLLPMCEQAKVVILEIDKYLEIAFEDRKGK